MFLCETITFAQVRAQRGYFSLSLTRFSSFNMALELRYKINGHELLKILIFIKICARKWDDGAAQPHHNTLGLW